jgi:hypothetical protein
MDSDDRTIGTLLSVVRCWGCWRERPGLLTGGPGGPRPPPVRRLRGPPGARPKALTSSMSGCTGATSYRPTDGRSAGRPSSSRWDLPVANAAAPRSPAAVDLWQAITWGLSDVRVPARHRGKRYLRGYQHHRRQGRAASRRCTPAGTRDAPSTSLQGALSVDNVPGTSSPPILFRRCAHRRVYPTAPYADRPARSTAMRGMGFSGGRVPAHAGARAEGTGVRGYVPGGADGNVGIAVRESIFIAQDPAVPQRRVPWRDIGTGMPGRR